MAPRQKKPVKSKAAALDEIRSDLFTIKETLSSLAGAMQRAPVSVARRIEVYFTRGESERKPYFARCEGVLSGTFRLSTIRAAILLVLLLDLEDRLDGGRGIGDTPQAIAETLKILESKAAEESTPSLEKIRVALYRFWDFCEAANVFSGPEYRLTFSDKTNRFSCVNRSGEEVSDGVCLEVTTDDLRVSKVLDRTLTRSPIAQVRKRRALYLPPGPHGSDQLLLEMYDHSAPLRVTSLYVRPPLPSYPVELLKRIGVSEKVLRRKELVLEGYRSGRIEFFEVLTEDTVWDLIRNTPLGTYKLYPEIFGLAEVAEHLKNLIAILKTHENYHFFITKAHIPFALVTYEIRSNAAPEYFTVFFDSFGAASSRDLGCFVLCDPAVYQNISEHIIQWVINHPSTLRSRELVCNYIGEVLEHLERCGPLESEEIHPPFRSA